MVHRQGCCHADLDIIEAVAKFPSRLVLALGLLPACWIAACSSPSSRPSETRVAKEHKDRKPAPDFALKDADGKTVRLSDYKGKVVLLNFWATWCGPCKIEIPWFMDFQRKHKDRGLQVIGVAMDDDGWDAVKPFVNQYAINYRVVLGNDQTSQAYGGVEALPTTFMIDRDGRIADVHVGLAARSDFEDGIQALLNDSEGGTVTRVAMPGFFFIRAR
jgi:cytochrome c biogenesis protein CcmG/thiol:disulfide interchange protein DsbE